VILYHEDCNTPLQNGTCPKCGYAPDMQSTYLAEPPGLDPGITKVVAWLQEHEFTTTDSGDGKSKAELIATGDALDFPHVFMTVDREFIIEEAHRLRIELENAGITPVSSGMVGVTVVVTYDPVDETAILMLTGLDDSMLPD
jgi:hypothetical protein